MRINEILDCIEQGVFKYQNKNPRIRRIESTFYLPEEIQILNQIATLRKQYKACNRLDTYLPLQREVLNLLSSIFSKENSYIAKDIHLYIREAIVNFKDGNTIKERLNWLLENEEEYLSLTNATNKVFGIPLDKKSGIFSSVVAEIFQSELKQTRLPSCELKGLKKSI